MLCGIGQVGRVVDHDLDPAVVGARGTHAGRGGDEAQVELALQPLRTISMCSSPRKPQRNPKPSAPDDSGANVSWRR
jgi:hypothetical protein